VVSPTQITATTGGGAIAGTYHLLVVDAANRVSAPSSADYFTYTAPIPSVTSVSPNTGPTSGGTNITITGSGFAAGDKVEIAQGNGAGPTAIRATDVTVVSPTQITATTGGGAIAGTYHLLVVDAANRVSAPSSADYFTYTD
jgi:hypothetical protein